MHHVQGNQTPSTPQTSGNVAALPWTQPPLADSLPPFVPPLRAPQIQHAQSSQPSCTSTTQASGNVAALPRTQPLQSYEDFQLNPGILRYKKHRNLGTR
ncbi:hypothetical protein OE88DRAFT_1658965 [Heliocybe sulcata]|uniref:Uncharacterized protein n=1 Tax=Heliocybe sulcata TaxID=5364 RepID=A0A5C3N0B8_9AGAM|nr:hypothetical protein OE88DRAFT_1658965 [Heliocybe sulcata]